MSKAHEELERAVLSIYRMGDNVWPNAGDVARGLTGAFAWFDQHRKLMNPSQMQAGEKLKEWADREVPNGDFPGVLSLMDIDRRDELKELLWHAMRAFESPPPSFSIAGPPIVRTRPCM